MLFANLADLFVAEEGIRHPDQSCVRHREVAYVPWEKVRMWEGEKVRMCDVSDVWCVCPVSDHVEDEEERGVEAMMIIIVMMKRASFLSWCVLKNAIMMITMMVEQTSLRLKRLQWWLKKPVWAPCSLSSNRSRWSFHFWRRVIEKSYSWRGKIW